MPQGDRGDVGHGRARRCKKAINNKAAPISYLDLAIMTSIRSVGVVSGRICCFIFHCISG